MFKTLSVCGRAWLRVCLLLQNKCGSQLNAFQPHLCDSQRQPRPQRLSTLNTRPDHRQLTHTYSYAHTHTHCCIPQQTVNRKQKHTPLAFQRPVPELVWAEQALSVTTHNAVYEWRGENYCKLSLTGLHVLHHPDRYVQTLFKQTKTSLLGAEHHVRSADASVVTSSL